MAVELDKIKNFLRIDEDLCEDDELLQSFTDAAQSLIEQMTGRPYDNSHLFTLGIMQLVGHWYENRTIYTTKTNLHDMPLSVQAIINHLGLNAGKAGESHD